MDPFTAGLVGIGVIGGSLFLIGALQNVGVRINETAVTMVLEVTKYGSFYFLIREMARVFT